MRFSQNAVAMAAYAGNPPETIGVYKHKLEVDFPVQNGRVNGPKLMEKLALSLTKHEPSVNFHFVNGHPMDTTAIPSDNDTFNEALHICAKPVQVTEKDFIVTTFLVKSKQSAAQIGNDSKSCLMTANHFNTQKQ